MDKHWIAQATFWLKASRHGKVIFKEGELQAEATVRQYRIVAPEAARTLARLVIHYSLDKVRSPLDTSLMLVAQAQGLCIIRPNTPVMPLNDAHSGGFFSSGVFK